MKIIGIVAEYNPFHNGHKYHICESRKAVSDDSAVICVMSGDYVQRGEAAIFSKYARAEAAVRGGADLILELPLPWCMSSAEKFSEGAVFLLGALGCVDYLSFGSESGDMDTLKTIAKALMKSDINTSIIEELRSGISYAAARQNAISKDIGSLATYLETPNNILAIEYLKALYNMSIEIEPITIRRYGAGHDEEGGSASSIRKMISSGKAISEYVPKESEEIYKREETQGRGPVTAEMLECAVLSRLRMLNEKDFAMIPDDAEGLSNRIYKAAHDETSLNDVYFASKSKRYALSRVRRMCMSAALRITKEDADGLPPYARVLSANEKGRGVLKIISERSSIPVITKPASVRNLNMECRRIFDIGSSAHDLFVMGYSSKVERRGNADWRTSPIII